MPFDCSGLWVPLITPFDTDDEVDLAALERLARRVIAEGARGLVALGTTGEPATLTPDETRAVVDVCRRVRADTGCGLMVGVGTNSTRTTVAAARALDPRTDDAALVVVPYYTRPSPAAVVDHYRAVAAASPVPLVAYNVPYRTGVGLGSDELLALAATPNIGGVKQAVGALDVDTLEVLRTAPSTFHVLAGDDAFIGPTILAGGTGAIAAAAHVATTRFAALVDAARVGDAATARALAADLLPLVRAGFAEPNPAVWKAALYALGELPTPAVRAPLAAASPDAVERLLGALGTVPAA